MEDSRQRSLTTPGAGIVKASAELTEMLCDSTNVYVTAGEDKAILKVNPHDTPEIDSDIIFSIPYGRYISLTERRNMLLTGHWKRA